MTNRKQTIASLAIVGMALYSTVMMTMMSLPTQALALGHWKHLLPVVDLQRTVRIARVTLKRPMTMVKIAQLPRRWMWTRRKALKRILAQMRKKTHLKKPTTICRFAFLMLREKGLLQNKKCKTVSKQVTEKWRAIPKMKKMKNSQRISPSVVNGMRYFSPLFLVIFDIRIDTLAYIGHFL